MDRKNRLKELLLTPVECSKNAEKIEMVGGVIKTPQKYYSAEDEDMSDFAVGFYETVYRDIIPARDGHLLSGDGYLIDREFAGDTIHSFNSLANGILGDCSARYRSAAELWPADLTEYCRHYHCLANFWLIPMRIGRTSAKKNSYDSLDIFLEQAKAEWDLLRKDRYVLYPRVKKTYRNYFTYFRDAEQLLSVHALNGYVTDPAVSEYYRSAEGCRLLMTRAMDAMQARADELAERFDGELTDYFRRCGLL